jgi:hypothetical protein
MLLCYKVDDGNMTLPMLMATEFDKNKVYLADDTNGSLSLVVDGGIHSYSIRILVEYDAGGIKTISTIPLVIDFINLFAGMEIPYYRLLHTC